jgi:hypothetical protein
MLRSVFVFAAAALMAGRAGAATLEPLDLAGLVGHADTIVHGRVVDTTPVWVLGGRQIDTLVTLEVGARFKGDSGQRLTFRTLGGQMGSYQTQVAGAPSFSVGDEVVMFLARGQGPAPEVVGLSQGALRVTLDGQGRRQVRAPLAHAAAPGARAFVSLRVMSLPELAHEITLVAGGAR